tara:strand:- start:1959 stop:2645 length:687 start_codon:yes stop_codon:yes gene_type:complete
MATDSGARIRKFRTEELITKLMHSATTSNYHLSINLPGPVISYIEQKKKVGIKGTNLKERINLSCIDAKLPGSSFATHDVKSDFMGVSEKMAYRRMYDEQMAVSMIVDPEYKTLHFFEGWMDYISGKEISERGDNNDYKNFRNGFRMNYPDGDGGYRQKNVIELFKFEKNVSERQSIKYTMIEGFPISMDAMEISYGPTDLLRLTVNFSFVRYVTEPYTFSGVRDSLN